MLKINRRLGWRDEGLDRRQLAIALCAAFLVCASSARAGIVPLAIDSNLSRIHMDVTRTDFTPPPDNTPPIGALVSWDKVTTYSTTPPYPPIPGADTTWTSTWGLIYVDWNPGVTLTFSTLSRVNYNVSGLYFPGRDNSDNLITSPPGTYPRSPGQFGFEVNDYFYGLSGTSMIFNLWQTFGSADYYTGATVANGGPSMPYIGNNRYVGAPGPDHSSLQALLAIDGWFDTVSDILVEKIPLSQLATGGTPMPNIFANGIVSFDGVTLTMPLYSDFRIVRGSTTYTIHTDGELVAHVMLPEPSTMVLFGFGIAGLLGCAWRGRKARRSFVPVRYL
jgi:hypothetical protein